MIKTTLGKIISTLLFLSGVLFTPVFATGSGTHLKVSPATQDVSLTPGETTVVSFLLSNESDTPVLYTLSSTPYQVKNEEYEPDFSTKNTFTMLSDWVRFAEKENIIAPNEEKRIEFTITVPEDVPTSGQYAAIMVEAKNEKQNNTINVNNRIGVLLYGHLKGKAREEGQLISHKIENLLLDKKVYSSELIKNTGNADFKVSASMKVKSFFSGKIVYNNESSPDSFTVLPNTERQSNQYWEGSPKLGLFRVESTIRFLEQEHKLESLVIVLPNWFMIALIAFIFIAILSIIFTVKTYRRQNHLPPAKNTD